MSRKSERHTTPSEEYETATWNAPRLLAIITVIAAIVAMVQGLWGLPIPGIDAQAAMPSMIGEEQGAAARADPPQESSDAAVSPAEEDEPDRPVIPSATPSAPQIGIVAGHLGSDSGAMCPDGLKEVDINLSVARQVSEELKELGYSVELLKEFDSRLNGYYADALVSIHADSCERILNATPPATGYKVASVEGSAVPDEERRLVACLARAYGNRTGMYYHANSITADMTRYHTFYEINPRTPAAIIEMGFMFSDRQILTEHSDLVAQGIVDGIICFLEEEGVALR